MRAALHDDPRRIGKGECFAIQAQEQPLSAADFQVTGEGGVVAQINGGDVILVEDLPRAVPCLIRAGLMRVAFVVAAAVVADVQRAAAIAMGMRVTSRKRRGCFAAGHGRHGRFLCGSVSRFGRRGVVLCGQLCRGRGLRTVLRPCARCAADRTVRVQRIGCAGRGALAGRGQAAVFGKGRRRQKSP